MSKQDYELIAEVLASVRPRQENYGGPVKDIQGFFWESVVVAFIARLMRENPNFNQQMFVNACRK